MSKSKVVIVGAGPGGLTAAMILAHRGVEVEVFEAKDHVGGRNAQLELGPYRFDVGPTFLMLKYLLDQVFEEAGAHANELLEFIQLEPMYRLQFDGYHLDSTTNQSLMATRLNAIQPGKGDAFRTYFEAETRRFERMEPCLQKDYSTWTSLFSRDLLKAIPRLSLGKSVLDVLNSYYSDEQLAVAFSFQSKYLGMSAWDCPGAFAMLSYVEYAYGIWHVIGGLSEISRVMAEQAVKNGATLHLNTRVKKLVLDGKKATGVELEDGTVVKADSVFINADFAHAMEQLVPPGVLRKYSPEQLQKKEFSCSTFMLYLGLDKVYDQPHHTVFFAKDYRKNVEDIFERKVLSDDTSFYIRNASITDPTLAPEGHSAVYVLVPCANLRADIDWEQESPRFRQLVLDQIKRQPGWEDLEEHIIQEKVIAPPDWESDYDVYAGATFNLAHTLGQMLYFRPRNRFEELKNCFLVGGGTHPGSGLPTIYESGRISANLFCKEKGVAYESLNKKV